MTRTSSPWVQRIPVISTAHMPDFSAIAVLNSPFMLWSEGGLVYVGEPEDIGVPWLREIAEKLRCPDRWVRLDANGPVIKGLTTYDW